MTIVFFTSLLLITLLLVVKYWEVSTGNKILQTVRSDADVFIENQIHKQVVGIPRAINNGKSLSKMLVIGILHGLVVFALLVVRFIEGHLVSAVDGIRGKHGVERRHGVSPFLRQMGDEDK